MRRLSASLVVVLAAGAVQFAAADTSGAAAPRPVKYASCPQLIKKYPHGVGRKGAKDHVNKKSDKPVTNFTVNTAVYNANTARDRDHDGIACETH